MVFDIKIPAKITLSFFICTRGGQSTLVSFEFERCAARALRTLGRTLVYILVFKDSKFVASGASFVLDHGVEFFLFDVEIPARIRPTLFICARGRHLTLVCRRFEFERCATRVLRTLGRTPIHVLVFKGPNFVAFFATFVLDLGVVFQFVRRRCI